MSSKRKWDQAGPNDSTESPAKVSKVDEGKTASEAAAAAAAIAAKIAAQFAGPGGSVLPGTKDPHDGDFTHDIDINDVRNRYLLTKGSTQTQVCLSVVPPCSWRADHDSPLPDAIRFMKRRELQSVRRVPGIQIARKQQRKTPLSTCTSPLRRMRFCKRPSRKSTNSSRWTWALL